MKQKLFKCSILAYLIIFLLSSSAASARIFGGTIELKVGETSSSISPEPNTYYTVTGTFTREGDVFSISARNGLTGRSCKIYGIKEGTGTLKWTGVIGSTYSEWYWTVNVTGSGGGGNSGGTTNDILINSTNFPDDNFRKVLLASSYGSDGKLSKSEMEKIKYSENLDLSEKNISNSKGLEYFTAFEIILIDDNLLTSLDVSKNTALTNLGCSNNKLTSLVVSKNTSLNSLNCHKNQLKMLDVSKNTLLDYLDCSSNQLTSLDLSSNSKIDVVYCNNNSLTSIKLSSDSELRYIDCSQNQIKGAEMDNLVNSLPYAFSEYVNYYFIVINDTNEGNVCTKQQVEAAKAKGWTVYRNRNGNELIQYQGSEDVYSENIEINSTNFPDANFRNYLLAQDYGKDGKLTESEIKAITEIRIENMGVKSIKGIEYFSALTELYCGTNQMTSLDVSKNTALVTLQCYGNKLTSLDLSMNKALTGLSCEDNQIKGKAMDDLIESLPKNSTDSKYVLGVFDAYVNEGNICTKAQVAAAKVKGWTVVYWNGEKYLKYEGSTKVSIIIGDVNSDNTVDGADLVALVNMILGKTDKKTEADVNGDGTVDGADYVALVNIVLGKTSNARKMAAASMSKLQIEPFDIKAGETKEMLIELSNPNDEVTLVQFDLQLPDGLSIAKEDGEYSIDIAGRTTWKKHSLDANATGGIVRFLLSSSKNSLIEGKSGNIISVKLMASSAFKGGDVKLRNILLVTPDEKKIQPDDCTLTIKQQGGGGGANVDTGNAKLSIGDFSINAGETKEMLINLTNPDDEITLVQFDLRLPNGLSIATSGGDYDIDIAGRTTWKKHSLDVNAIDGIVRFLLSSSKNSVLEGNSGSIISIKLKASSTFSGGTIALENILLVTPDEKNIRQEKVQVSIVSDNKFELADGQRYYLKNKANGLFISCGGDWGTHIVVDNRGLDLLLKKAKDNVHWIIETNFRTNISDSGGAIGQEGYVDNYVDTELTIKNLQDNVFSIAAPNGKYLTNSFDNNVYFIASSASSEDAQWEFISEKDVLAQRNASLQNASASTPVDATFLIKDANFNRFDLRIENWYYEEDDANHSTVNWGCSVGDTESVFEIIRSEANNSYRDYTLFQGINLIPGKYKLEAQGFYRDGDYSVAEKARSNGKEKKNAFLFAGNNKVALKSIFDEASSNAKKGWSTNTTHGYIPDTKTEAGYTFQTGAYNNVLEFTVTKESEIRIGVALEDSYTLNNWTTIDNFQLTYYGNDNEASLPDMANASDANPVECTDVIKSASFETPDGKNTSEGWTNPGNLGNDAFQRSALAMEFWQVAFNMYQTITGLPAGTYKLTVDAWVRMGKNNENYAIWMADPNATMTYLYAVDGKNTVYSAPIANIMKAGDGISGNEEFVVNEKEVFYMPNDLVSGIDNIENNEGVFTNEVICKVGKDGILTVGIRKDEPKYYSWVVLDNFRLFYLGTNSSQTPSGPATAINDVKSQPDVTNGAAVFSLSGQRLSAPRKGLNIIGGKKVVMK